MQSTSTVEWREYHVHLHHGVSVVIVLGTGHGALQWQGKNTIRAHHPPSKKPGELIPLKRAIELHINNQLEEASKPRELE
jgi:predicted Fe-Mo cluster-binding NifX family protein